MPNIEDLPLVGGDPAVDLVNTIERARPAQGKATDATDHLATPQDVLRWARRAELLTDTEAQSVRRVWSEQPPLAAAALHELRALREALHRVFGAVLEKNSWSEDTTAAALAAVHRDYVSAVTRSELRPPTARAVALLFGSDPARLVNDRVAERAVELLRSDQLARLRDCPIAAGGCGWLFLDHSRNGSRRWCRMADCGTQVKSKRLTERRRTARATGAPR